MKNAKVPIEAAIPFSRINANPVTRATIPAVRPPHTTASSGSGFCARRNAGRPGMYMARVSKQHVCQAVA